MKQTKYYKVFQDCTYGQHTEAKANNNIYFYWFFMFEIFNKLQQFGVINSKKSFEW